MPPVSAARIANSMSRVEPSGRRSRRRPKDSPRRTCARQVSSSGASDGSSSTVENRSPMSASADRPASTVAASLTARIRRSRSATNIALAERRNAVQKTGAQPGSPALAGAPPEVGFGCCDVRVKRVARAFDPQVDAGRPVDRAVPCATAHHPAGVMPGEMAGRPLARSCDLPPRGSHRRGIPPRAALYRALAPADEICAGGLAAGRLPGGGFPTAGWPWCCGSGSPQRPLPRRESPRRESNPQPPAYKADALPVELRGRRDQASHWTPSGERPTAAGRSVRHVWRLRDRV